MIINDKNIQPDKPIVAAWKNVRGFKAMMDTHFNAPPLSPFGLITNIKEHIRYQLAYQRKKSKRLRCDKRGCPEYCVNPANR